MIQVFDMERASGKKTRVIELLKQDPSLYCIIPNKHMKQFYPKHLHNQILYGTDIIDRRSFEGKKVARVVLDEGFLYRKNQIAELYYTLGLLKIKTISFGTS
ncbi:hypothetical protein [Paenibacillus sp. Marseille-Q4541]|uniref:hypothetical protein n=1 Tax=Paenibacillus sp. Marseille-Q4541 TaxID=2831522 RepID=UPI001BAE52CB|nr:hypothetical protein [Paenibacillus sp. Marseille-Q4541]